MSPGRCFSHLWHSTPDKDGFYDSDPLAHSARRLPPALPAEADAVLGGADTATDEGNFTTVLSNIEKVSKVFNYMARIFSSTSAMLNNFITIYNTVKQLNEFIANNF